MDVHVDTEQAGESVPTPVVDRIHRALRNQSMLEQVTETIDAQTWATDSTGKFIRANQSWLNAHGIDSPGLIVGKSAHDLLDPVTAAQEVAESLAVLDSGKPSVSVQSNGNTTTNIVRVPIIDAGETLGVVSVAVDQISGALAEASTAQANEIDPLTGAHNIESLHEHIVELLDADADSSLLLIDLDDFHVVSDSLGHVIADQYLVGAAQRLVKVFGLRLFRVGGDKFVVVLPTTDRTQLTAVADQILQRWHRPLVVDGTEIYGGVSIGIAPLAGQKNSPLVLQDAEMALRRSKTLGKNRSTIFDLSQRKDADVKLGNHMLVRRAVRHKEFSLAWQPIYELSSGKISAVEALLRWQPNGGPKTHPAAEFMPYLEASGLIQPVGKQALEDACSQYRNWSTNSKVGRSVPININVSRAEFASDLDIVTDVTATLQNYEVPPEHLTLEIADFSICEDQDKFVDDLKRLSQLGVRIAIDDFGFGLSPIGLVAGLPIQVTKIGRAFSDRIEEGQEDPFLSMIQNAAASVGQQTIVQGVENLMQLNWLRSRGWTHAQGYFLAKPMDPSEMTSALAENTK